jgi:hypothetical protein
MYLLALCGQGERCQFFAERPNPAVYFLTLWVHSKRRLEGVEIKIRAWRAMGLSSQIKVSSETQNIEI